MRAGRQLELVALADGRGEHRLILIPEPGDQEVHRLRLELRDLDVEVLLERERHGFFEPQLAQAPELVPGCDGARRPIP